MLGFYDAKMRIKLMNKDDNPLTKERFPFKIVQPEAFDRGMEDLWLG